MSDTIDTMTKTFTMAKWLTFSLVAAGILALATPTKANESHTIGLGETLSGIALRYGVDLRELADRNGIQNIDRVFAGQTLVIPGAGMGGATAPAAANDSSHHVSAGENLSTIAARYGMSVAAVAQANSISDPNRIFAGQVIRIPGSGAPASSTGSSGGSSLGQPHTVSAGESLSSIAARYGVSLTDLAQANNLNNPNLVLVGQFLRIPGVGGGGATPAYSRVYIEQALIAAEVEFGLPTGVLRGLAMQESGWQQHVVSSAGAIGVMQLLPATAAWLVVDFVPSASNWRTDPRDNIRLGAALMRYNLQFYGWDLDYALAAYYQGHGNIQRFGIFGETWAYIANVRALMGWYN